jgi:palmitoyltransferase
MLWIELFDSHLDNELPNFADMKYKMDIFPRQDKEAQPKDEPVNVTPQQSRGPDPFKIPQQPASSPFLLYIGEIGSEVKRFLAQHGEKAGANEIAAECRRRWQTMSEEERNVCLQRVPHQRYYCYANSARNGMCYMLMW